MIVYGGPRRKPAERLRWGEEKGMERVEFSPQGETEQSGISFDEVEIHGEES